MSKRNVKTVGFKKGSMEYTGVSNTNLCLLLTIPTNGNKPAASIGQDNEKRMTIKKNQRSVLSLTFFNTVTGVSPPYFTGWNVRFSLIAKE